MKFSFLVTLSLSISFLVFAPGLYAQDAIPLPGPYSTATVEPSKSTMVQNGVQMVRQFEVAPENIRISPITSDYEAEFFKEQSDGWVMMEGVSHNLRASYKWVSGDGRNELSAAGTEKIIVTSEETMFNHLVGVKGRRFLLLSDGLKVSSGLSADLLLYSKAIIDMISYEEKVSSLSTNFGLDLIAEKGIGAQRVVGGVIVQENIFNETFNTDLGMAVLWGMPIQRRFSVNVDALYRITLLTMQKEVEYLYDDYYNIIGTEDKGYKAFDYSQSGISTPHSLALGLSGTILMTDQFGLNVGYRTQLLTENYNSNTVIVGGKFAF